MSASISLRDTAFLGLVLLVSACAGDGCGSCSCNGGEDTESAALRSSGRGSAGHERASSPTEEDPTAEAADPHVAARGGSAVVGNTAEVPENEEEVMPTGSAVLDRPTSGQVGVVLRDLRGRAAECSRGVQRSVVVEMTISGRSGRATSSRVIGPSAGTPEAACVEALMREAQFPTFERPEMTTAYAYRLPGLEPDGGAASIEAGTAVSDDGGTMAIDDAGESDASALP